MDSEPVITSIILSDGVIIEHGTAKLSLIGCFNTLQLPTIPAVHPGFFATVGLTNLTPGGSKLAVTVRIEIEGTGHVIASTGGEVKIDISVIGDGEAKPDSNVRKLGFDIPFRFNPIFFQKGGPYTVAVLVNNDVVDRKNIMVSQLPTQPLKTPPQP